MNCVPFCGNLWLLQGHLDPDGHLMADGIDEQRFKARGTSKRQLKRKDTPRGGKGRSRADAARSKEAVDEEQGGDDGDDEEAGAEQDDGKPRGRDSGANVAVGSGGRLLLGALGSRSASRRRVASIGPRIFWSPEEDRILLCGFVRHRVLYGPPLMRAGGAPGKQPAVPSATVAPPSPTAGIASGPSAVPPASGGGGDGSETSDESDDMAEAGFGDKERVAPGQRQHPSRADMWVWELLDLGALPHPEKSCWVRQCRRVLSSSCSCQSLPNHYPVISIYLERRYLTRERGKCCCHLPWVFYPPVRPGPCADDAGPQHPAV
jgi:hypothetical protein